MINKDKIILGAIALIATPSFGQTDSISSEHKLKDVTVNAMIGMKSKSRVDNTEIIGRNQLVRAACCNLGESFTSNPSVDVSYSDAATGATQIKLLGLSGTYVQMLTENIPNLRGASIPYSLGFVPGDWMQSIQVSKGASSVKNGYESMTGQINIEFLKPQGIDGVRGNVYFNSKLALEANADASIHLNDKLSTSLLLHVEDSEKEHDKNGDGFMDMPKKRQYNFMHRWAYVSPKFISQLSMRVLQDRRNSGQSKHLDTKLWSNSQLYTIETTNKRFEGQWKNAIILSQEHNSSIALMLHGSHHSGNYDFGYNHYNVQQTNGYAQLMYETDFNEHHNLSVGASYNHDRFNEEDKSNNEGHLHNVPYNATHEATAGIYAQYTYKLGDKLTVMPGIRGDFSSKYDGFITPRLHIKYSPIDLLTIRASAGKGYRTPHAIAENISMMASGREIYMDENLKQEEAWNYGLSASLNVPIAGKKLELNAEYYYTDFKNQMIVNYDGKTYGKHSISFENLNGKSYSHTMQIDATYPFFEGFSATGAFRLNDVRTTYDGELHNKPLTSRFKGLLTLSYKTPMELWHFDLTGQLNGHGELYDQTKYPTYFQLQAQVTREFRHFSIYVGGENLTNYSISNPIINAANPWSPSFDATQIWGPTDGAMGYIGIRLKFEKL